MAQINSIVEDISTADSAVSRPGKRPIHDSVFSPPTRRSPVVTVTVATLSGTPHKSIPDRVYVWLFSRKLFKVTKFMHCLPSHILWQWQHALTIKKAPPLLYSQHSASERYTQPTTSTVHSSTEKVLQHSQNECSLGRTPSRQATYSCCQSHVPWCAVCSTSTPLNHQTLVVASMHTSYRHDLIGLVAHTKLLTATAKPLVWCSSTNCLHRFLCGHIKPYPSTFSLLFVEESTHSNLGAGDQQGDQTRSVHRAPPHALIRYTSAVPCEIEDSAQNVGCSSACGHKRMLHSTH